MKAVSFNLPSYVITVFVLLLATSQSIFADNKVSIVGLHEKQHPNTSAVTFVEKPSVYPENLPFSEIVRLNDTLYLSGMIPVEQGTIKLVEGGIKEQSHQVMTNIRTMLEANDYSMKNLVKCTVMLSDISMWGEFNKVYQEYFTAPYPARSAMGVNGLALGALVEVECIGSVY